MGNFQPKMKGKKKMGPRPITDVGACELARWSVAFVWVCYVYADFTLYTPSILCYRSMPGVLPVSLDAVCQP